MSVNLKQRIGIEVPRGHVTTIRSCLAPHDVEGFSVRPVISGWTRQGTYWSSERRFASIGETVLVEFDIDPALVAPLLASGFGIVSGDIVRVRVMQPEPAKAHAA